MSDIGIQFVLDNLKQIAVYNANLITNVKGEVEGLIRDLAIFKAFIEDTTEKSSEHKVVWELVKSIRDLTFEAEDAVDAFVVEATDHRSKKWIQKVFGSFDHTHKLRQVAKKAEIIRAKAKEIYDNLIFGYKVCEGGDPYGRRRMERKIPDVEKDNVDPYGRRRMERTIPDVEKDNVVGFDEATTTLIDVLTGKTEDLQVISIVGMGGVGKTTLANKVYNDPRVAHEFSIQSWICLSQTYRRKELFLSILQGVTQVTFEHYSMCEDELAEEVYRNLTWKYLIVVDDVWGREDWDSIRRVFPNRKNGSRILLTSRNKAVAVHANLYSPPYILDFLTDAQSWELLQNIVFDGKVPEENHDLMDVGMRIALECHGLPLAVVIIAGMLQTNKHKDWWETVAKSVNRLVGSVERVLALSYYYLPPYLKACFLYFGVFPEDYKIPVWILIRLWIAEGFVQKFGNVCLEDIAEEHLEDLVARNLVLVVQRSFNGRIKTCRIHGMLHDLCLEKAQEESFLSEIKENGMSPVVSIINRRISIHSGVRRISIHSGVLEYISSKPFGSRFRSFLCFAKDRVSLPYAHVAYIPEEFKLLRVYHILPIISPRFPIEIENLVYLKYVAFSGDFKIIPATMSKLWNLETLIVETSSRTIDIQADIWNMLQLRHLHSNAASQLHGPVAKKGKDRDNAIQTLSSITPESCTKDVLGKTPCIKKLGIRGKLATLLENDGALFDNLSDLLQLVTLKLLNDTFPLPPSESKLQGLPLDKFPPYLKRLTLADTFLDWKHMSVLGMLLELEELKLKDNAFTGERWSLDKGFKKLKTLQIWKTDLVYWEAKADHFLSLQHIVLRDCTKLQAIPSSLGTSKTLQTIKLHQTSQAAATSARDIKQQLDKGLKLDIFP